MSSRLARQSALRLDLRVALLSGLALLLVVLSLRHADVSWTAAPPSVLIIAAGLLQIAGLLTAVFKRDTWARTAQPIFTLAVAALGITLLWTWREVLVNLAELRWRLGAVYLVTLAGYGVHARVRPEARAGLLITLGLSALPVLLVSGCYLLLGAAVGLEIADVRLLIRVGLAITYFNLGATALGGGPPLDAGLKLPDGHRLLGDGKTWRGSLGGLILAALAFTSFGGRIGAGLLVGSTTLLGDAAASFLKRRLAQEQGQPVPLLDQLDGLLPLLFLASSRLSPTLPSGSGPLLVIGTLFVQLFGNRVLFYLGKKNVPW